MSLLIVGFLILFPLLLVGAASGLGILGAVFFLDAGGTGVNLRLLNINREHAAVWLAISIPIAAALTVLLPTFEDFKKVYGDFMLSLWIWTLAGFFFGGLIGWGYCRR